MKNLIPLSDFVLEQQWNKNGSPKCDISERAQSWQIIVNYAKFQKQPLKLEYFVPCDEDGNVLKKPDRSNFGIWTKEFWNRKVIYEKAKEKVLFEGFEQKGGLSVAKAICQTYQVIEDLTYKKIPLVNLTLTPSALQQIGIKE